MTLDWEYAPAPESAAIGRLRDRELSDCRLQSSRRYPAAAPDIATSAQLEPMMTHAVHGKGSKGKMID